MIDSKHPSADQVDAHDHVWVDITGVPPVASAGLERALVGLEPLRLAWEAAAGGDQETFGEARRRALRHHAIETGIIERLYDVDWGTTEALVAEGITLEVAEREGGVNGDALAIIQDQYDALEYVSAAAKGTRPLTVQFIRELHQLIVRHQATYEAIDPFGRQVTPPLLHGDWKQVANHVDRPDGTLLEYCPPSRVQDQVESLVELYNNADGVHPLIRAAWLHHRFIRIHPFQDGNGRVGRALVLLELLRAKYAPLVVERHRREDYIRALDRANDGDLEPLILFFAEVERRGMIRQFQAPIQITKGLGVLEVARAASAKLADLQVAAVAEKRAAFASFAASLQYEIGKHLGGLEVDLRNTFRKNDPAASVRVQYGHPGVSGSRYWHGQLVKLANVHDFYANLGEGSWWNTLTIKMLGERMRFLVAVVRVGAGETGVGALMIGAERLYRSEQDGEPADAFEWLFNPTPEDQVPFTINQSVESVWIDAEALIDRGLAAAIAEHARHLG